jgi:hypothetical protein
VAANAQVMLKNRELDKLQTKYGFTPGAFISAAKETLRAAKS